MNLQLKLLNQFYNSSSRLSCFQKTVECIDYANVLFSTINGIDVAMVDAKKPEISSLASPRIAIIEISIPIIFDSVSLELEYDTDKLSDFNELRCQSICENLDFEPVEINSTNLISGSQFKSTNIREGVFQIEFLFPNIQKQNSFPCIFCWQLAAPVLSEPSSFQYVAGIPI